MLSNLVLVLLSSFSLCISGEEYFSCSSAPDHSAPTTCVSSLSEIGELRRALSKVQPDLRIASLNQFAWKAKQNGYATIREWLKEILPTTDIIAFQEFSEGDFDSVNSFMTQTDFQGRTFKELRTTPSNPSLKIYASSEAQFSNSGLTPYGWDNFNRNRGWADGYERYVLWTDIVIKGRTLKLANNHGCLGSMPNGECSSKDKNCNSAGSNGKFPHGGCGNNGGRAIVETLRSKGFFANQGADSLFFCDCNDFSPPELLCAEGMNVRGRLNCGNPNLDFIGYGKNFELVGHYGFGGTGSRGDSDHKSVVLDLRFADRAVTPSQPATCVQTSSRCMQHIDWALRNGRKNQPHLYPEFEAVTGASLSSASTQDMIKYFHCKNVHGDDCGSDLPPCCGDDACQCGESSESSSGCTDGFSNVKLQCGGCKVLTQSTSTHPTCNAFCQAQGRTCVSAAEEVDNNCQVKSTHNCDTDFSLMGTSDALCECSQDAFQPTESEELTQTPGECVEEEITIATYNILYKNCGGYYDNCKCSNSSPARYAANSIMPDILGTQENGCQVDFGNDMGDKYEVVPYDCQSCNHNAIYFNKNKIEYANQRGVENTVYRDSYSLRMYSWSRMQTKNGFAFWVFNVHNPHEHGNPRGFQGKIAEQMINKWKSVSNGEPAVFTGDFNPHKDSNSWERYATANGLTKAGQSSGGVCGFCDQVYYSSGDFEVVSRKVHGTGGSDHNAYSVILKPKCNGSSRPSRPTVTPKGDECKGFSNVKRECGGCKFLTKSTSLHSTCNAFCAAQGRSCVSAAEEVNNDCAVKQTYSCETNFASMGTSDALCECSTTTLDPATVTNAPITPVAPGVDEAFSSDGWTLVWSDEFDSLDRAKWSVTTSCSGNGNNEKQCYTDSDNNRFIRDGKLVIKATYNPQPWWNFGAKNYNSAKLKSAQEWSEGWFKIRAKLPRGRGTWPAIWMLPRDMSGGWPEAGEIDIMEHVGFDQDVIHSTMHTGAFNHMKNTQRGGKVTVSTATTDFHEYSLLWTRDFLKFWVDDRCVVVLRRESNYGTHQWPFNSRPFYLILNLAIGGNWGGIQGIDNGAFPTEMEIDYVRVYQGGDTSALASMSCPDPSKQGQFRRSLTSEEKVLRKY